MKRYSSVTLQVSPKNPISEEKLKITSPKIKISPQKKFPEWFGHKEIERICFWKSNMKNSSNWFFQRNVGFDLKRAQTSEHCFRLTHHTLYPGKGPESLELPKYMCLTYPLARNGPCCSLHSRPQLALWGRFSYSDARRHPRGSLVPYEGKENQFHPAPALQGRVEPDGLGSCCRGLSAHSCSSPRSKDSPPFFYFLLSLTDNVYQWIN